MAQTLTLQPVAAPSARGLSPLNPSYRSPTEQPVSVPMRRRSSSDTSPLRRQRSSEDVRDKLHDFSASVVVSHAAVAARLKQMARLSNGEIARVLLDAPAHAQMQRVAHSHDTVLMLADRGNMLRALDLDDAHMDRARKMLRADTGDVLLQLRVADKIVLMVAGFGPGALAPPASLLGRVQNAPHFAPPHWLLQRNLGASAADATRQRHPLASSAARLLADAGAHNFVPNRSLLVVAVPEDVDSLQRAVGRDEQRSIAGHYGLMVTNHHEAPVPTLASRPVARGEVTEGDSAAVASWEAIDVTQKPRKRLGGKTSPKPLNKVVSKSLAGKEAHFRSLLADIAERNGLLPRLMPSRVSWSRFVNPNPVHFYADTPANRAFFAAQDLAHHREVVARLNLDQDLRLQAIPPQTHGYFGERP